MITLAVIPAAGFGTRFLPATKSVAKEMLPIVDKPCIQYLVEEAVESGIKEIIFIINKDKGPISTHFDSSKKLKEFLRKNSKFEEAKKLEKIEKLAKFTYVFQPYPKGDGDAILCAKNLIKGRPFAVLFGDDIWDSKTPPLAQLIKVYKKFNSPIIGLTKVPREETHKYGIADLSSRTTSKNTSKNTYQIKNLVEKPANHLAPSNFALTGKYIVTPELFKTLEKAQSQTKDKELRLIDGMHEFLKKSKIYGCEIQGQRFDTGDKLGYLKAVVHFALKNKELNKEFKEYLKSFQK